MKELIVCMQRNIQEHQRQRMRYRNTTIRRLGRWATLLLVFVVVVVGCVAAVLFRFVLIHKYDCMTAWFCQCVPETQKVNELNYNEAAFF